MKATKIFSLLSFSLLIFACYVDVYETGKSSSSYYYSEPAPSYNSSSSSQTIVPQSDSLHCEKHSYKIIKMGLQMWTAQNLNEIPKSGASWCYGNFDENCNIHGYGRLYDWEAAMSICSACDGGWRLPTKEDFDELLNWDVEDLIRTSVWHAVYAGYRHNDESIGFRFKDRYGDWWSSSVGGKGNRPYYYELEIGGNQMHRYDQEKNFGFSVRCIKK